ncbi:hypothetical protein [Bacillus sp. DX3.1]|nr:hypothetical protein [Bacillus sp. DX3.1]WJE80236.1 hypothetical protein QRE67_17270 [Bacillus sp. DX3.1]
MQLTLKITFLCDLSVANFFLIGHHHFEESREGLIRALLIIATIMLLEWS